MRYLITMLLFVAFCVFGGTAMAEDLTDYQFIYAGHAQTQDCGGNCATSCCPTPCCPAWVVEAGAIFLTRESHNAQTLVTDVSGTDVMNMREFNFEYEPGINFQITRQTRYGWDVHVEFSMVDWWESSRTVTGTDLSAIGAWNSGGFGGGEEVVGRYASNLYSTEVNFRPQTQRKITPFFGFRWIELHEDFVLDMTQASGLYVPGIVSATNTDNHLWGFQVGADMVVLDRGPFQLETQIKAGVFNNQADQYTYSTNEGLGVVAQADAARSHTAFAGDLKLAGKFQVSEGMALRAGYQLLWLEGVALAPAQFDNTDLLAGTATLDTNDSPFYHGAFASIEITR